MTMVSQNKNWSKYAELVREAPTENFIELIKLSGLDPKIDFRFKNWSGADFSGCDLTGSDFSGARICDCNFKGAKISGACFDGAIIDDIRHYTGDNIGVHEPNKPRMSPLKKADDWKKYVKNWQLTEEVDSDKYLPIGSVFQDAPFAPEMVIIPPGTFLMGSPELDNEAHHDEYPQHEMTISKRFAVSRYAVTFEEYDAYCAATDVRVPHDYNWGRGRRPVIDVSWHDAQNYIEWLNHKTGYIYRLLQEANWEYACRAGGKPNNKYHFGNDEAALDDFAWCFINSEDKTHPVGEKKPNSFGFYDMHGNICEWVNDRYGEYEQHLQTDFERVALDSYRVSRGGGWDGTERGLRSASRGKSLPDDRYSNYGFRLLRQHS